MFCLLLKVAFGGKLKSSRIRHHIGLVRLGGIACSFQPCSNASTAVSFNPKTIIGSYVLICRMQCVSEVACMF